MNIAAAYPLFEGAIFLITGTIATLVVMGYFQEKTPEKDMAAWSAWKNKHRRWIYLPGPAFLILGIIRIVSGIRGF